MNVFNTIVLQDRIKLTLQGMLVALMYCLAQHVIEVMKRKSVHLSSVCIDLQTNLLLIRFLKWLNFHGECHSPRTNRSLRTIEIQTKQGEAQFV